MSDGSQQGQQQSAVSTTTSTGATQMAVSSQINVQGQAVTQQQLQQMQQQSSNQQQGQHQQGGQNQMQQLQVVQQQLQNQTYLPQIYNTQGQQLIMPGNILHHGLNPQIQVIAAGKTFQPNQLTGQHMLSTGNIGYTAIPTSGSPNNQTYILGQFINSPQNQLQQHGKHGDISKVISPQIGTQLQQGQLWASPHTFLTAAPNSIFIRGTQPDQTQMFIQQQQSAAQQHFSMPLTAAGGQIPTSTVSTSNMQQGQQQQNVQGHPNQQQQNSQSVTIKTPANLQPKPLQIQPQPQQQQQMQQQQMQQLQQVTMTQAGGTHQIQMIPQMPPTSQTTVIPQSISISQQPQLLQQGQQQTRQLTILPQQTQAQLVQSPQMQFIQQQTTTAPQAIRPNYTSSSVSIVTTQAPQTQQLANPTNTTPQQRAKIRKPGVGRGAAANGQQQPKPVFPRASASPGNAGTGQQQRQIQSQGMSQQQLALGRVPPGTTITQQTNIQPLKTINLSALQAQGMGDGTMVSQANTNHFQINLQQPNQIQLFPSTSVQQPNPMNMNTSTPPQIQLGKLNSEPNIKGDPEKENSKDQDEVQGKHKLPKAMVKPQVLTHVIEGFVIQEAAEPFPMPKSLDFDEPPRKKAALGGEFANCEACGKVELKAKFKRKKFCSSACAKSMKTAQQKQPNQSPQHTPGNQNQKGVKGRKWGESSEADTDETSSSGDQPTMSENDGDDEPKVNPLKWDVNEVVDFVKSLPGCAEYASDFLEQEIDGQALLLLKADHLMSAMNMKLGPALKLCAKIEAARAGCGMGNAEPAK